MQLLLGTTNLGKITEIKECLTGIPYNIISPDDLYEEIESPDETGNTFEENAVQKAKHYFDASKIPTIADDSGIIVDALKDELGVYTRRWGVGEKATDEEWINFFLERMSKEKNKKARFECHIAHFDTDGNLHMFNGTCNGKITDELLVDYLPGLPISACFRPDGFDLVYSAMTVEQKNTISHRGKAMKQFREFIIR